MPERAIKRARARLVLHELRKFDAANRHSKRTKNWSAKDTGPNVEMFDSLPVLRARSRELHRNSAIAPRITDVIVGDVVGNGVVVQSSNDKLDSIFETFTDTTEIDFDGHLDFYGMQALAIETICQCGEVLVRRIIDKNYKHGIKFQILEPDFVDFNKNETYEDGYTLQGVKYNSKGLIVGYWIFNEHPGDISFLRKGFTSELRSSEEYKLIFNRTKRPGQVRGYVHTAPVMLTIREVSDTFSAELARRKIATCFAGFITDTSGNNEKDEDYDDISKIKPGTMAKLAPGQDVKFNTPPPASDFSPFVKDQLRLISIGAGVTYEALSGDFSQTNFSSARMGRLNIDPIIHRWQSHILINQFCRFICDEYKKIAVIKNNAKEEDTFTYTPPVKSLIDPITENNASKSEIRNGFTSLSEVIRSRGRDPKRILGELRDDLKLIDELGLTLDTDGRQVSLAGNQNILKEEGADAKNL